MKKIKNLILVVCIIFSTLTLIYFTMYDSLDVTTARTFLAVAALDGLLALLLLGNEERSPAWLLVRQVIYFGLVLTSALLALVWLGYELSLKAVLLNGLAVVFISVVIKFLLYRQDKQDAAEINKYLVERQKK